MAQHRYTAEEIIHRLREAENGRLKRVVAELTLDVGCELTITKSVPTATHIL